MNHSEAIHAGVEKENEKMNVEIDKGDGVEESIIATRERRIEEAKQLTMFSDVFMTTALKDKAACQHILRILTGIKTLVVIEVRTQYRISNVTSHDAILDVLAEDGDGHLISRRECIF